MSPFKILILALHLSFKEESFNFLFLFKDFHHLSGKYML